MEAPTTPFMHKIMQALGGLDEANYSRFSTHGSENSRNETLLSSWKSTRFRKTKPGNAECDCVAGARMDFCERLMELQLGPAEVGIVFKEWEDDYWS